MKKTLKEIAALLNGEVVGDEDIVVEHIRGIDEAREGDLTFIANPQYRKKLETTGASAVLVSSGTECAGKNLVIVGDPYLSLGRLLGIFYPDEPALPGISGRAFIEEGAQISDGATVYPGVSVCRGARIERGVVLYPGVFVGRDAVIGEGSILYPNVCVYRKCL
ncbi:MAG: UDP-3-O-(3-hydroxymyristoyl)glucosamine N-acyltransferase, partial [Syntrophobacteraceae bacterium CG23_combo_of_CG06-09_8_20_14_all_50_8]